MLTSWGNSYHSKTSYWSVLLNLSNLCSSGVRVGGKKRVSFIENVELYNFKQRIQLLITANK